MSRVVTLRYWAAAKAAAGVAQDVLDVDGPTPLTDLRARAIGLHPGERFARVLGVCSVLVDGRVAREPVDVDPDATVEFLPPFAGG